MTVNKKYRISVDAMGGDFAPEQIVKGAIEAARELDVEIILAGIEQDVARELSKHDTKGIDVRVVPATDVIQDGLEAAFDVFRRPNNSVSVAARLVKEGEADAVVSAGNTGASMVAAMQHLGTLPGIERPVVGGPFLGFAPNTVVLDIGANVGTTAFSMANFAVVGTIFARSFLNIKNPTVGLLNVGAEEGKGNDLARETYALLKKSGLNFIGNVEGMDVVSGKANVVICDGFVGNILMKFCEGMGSAIGEWLRNELKDDVSTEKLTQLTGTLNRLTSPAVALGGGPMLGVNGIACVAHGNSRAEHVVGTIRQAKLALESGFVNRLKSELEKTQKQIS